MLPTPFPFLFGVPVKEEIEQVSPPLADPSFEQERTAIIIHQRFCTIKLKIGFTFHCQDSFAIGLCWDNAEKIGERAPLTKCAMLIHDPRQCIGDDRASSPRELAYRFCLLIAECDAHRQNQCFVAFAHQFATLDIAIRNEVELQSRVAQRLNPSVSVRVEPAHRNAARIVNDLRFDHPINYPRTVNARIRVMYRDAVVIGCSLTKEFADAFAPQFAKARYHILSALTEGQIGIECRVLPEDICSAVRAFKQIPIEVIEDIFAEHSVTGATRNFDLGVERAMEI